jgi:F-type H+-transporting ATPase subunit gamma
VKYEEVGLFQNPKWSHAQTIAQTAIKEFLAPEISSVYLVYNEFKSVITQRVVLERLLPIPKLPQEEAAGVQGADYLFEPSPEELLDTLLPYHVSVQVARALLESSAAEHAARMQSMDNATRNAKEMVDRLTLYMNKVRQAQITREIIEVVSGAQSV